MYLSILNYYTLYKNKDLLMEKNLGCIEEVFDFPELENSDFYFLVLNKDEAKIEIPSENNEEIV